MEPGQFYKVYLGDPSELFSEVHVEKEILDKLGLYPNQQIDLETFVRIARCQRELYEEWEDYKNLIKNSSPLDF